MTSLWWDTLPADLTEPLGFPLEADVTADVAIIGAGFTGLWTAYYLLEHQPDLRVVIIEAEYAGFGASGRNGGWCSALFPASMSTVAQMSDRAQAIRLQDAMHDTVDEVASIADREGWDIQAAKGGTIVAARSPLQWQRAREEVAEWRTWGYGDEDYSLLGPNAARAMLGATDVLGATYTPHCLAVHPARLVRHLARTVVDRGATIYEGSRAEAWEPRIVRTAHGSVRADYVIRATEGYTAGLDGQRRTMVPLYSLMLATEPLSAQDWELIGLADRPTFSDGRHLIIYGQRTADDRIAFGGRGAPYHFRSRIRPHFDQEPAVFAELWRTLTDLFPFLADRAVTHTWGGPLGVSRDWFASCGLDRTTGLGWSGGYVGDGVGTSNLGGRTLADLILGRDTDLATLPWVGHRSPAWEPEPLRWLATGLGLRVMGSADHVEARTGRPARRARIMGRFLGH